MAMFNSYVKLPEGIPWEYTWMYIKYNKWDSNIIFYGDIHVYGDK